MTDFTSQCIVVCKLVLILNGGCCFFFRESFNNRNHLVSIFLRNVCLEKNCCIIEKEEIIHKGALEKEELIAKFEAEKQELNEEIEAINMVCLKIILLI